MTKLYGFRSSAVSVLAGHGKSTVFEHMEIVKSVTPAPLLTLSKHNLDMLKSFTPIVPVWLDKALPEQRVEARRRIEASVTAHSALNDAMAGVKALKEFAEPLLKKRISEFFNIDLDVNKTWIELTRPARLFSSPQSEYFTLLEAALHNFEEEEARPSHFYRTEIFTYEPLKTGIRKRVSMNTGRFIELCRELNLGQQYQAHIKAVLKWDDVVAQGKWRDVFVGYHKAALKAASQIALLKDDIEPKHHSALMEIISGHTSVRVDGKRVWSRSLSFMGMALHRCIIFELAEPDDQSILDKLWPIVDTGPQNGFIAYLPDDPDHPVKYYPSLNAFKARLISQFSRKNPGASQSSEAPTDYQNFFSRFVKHKDRAKYFTSFTELVPREFPRHMTIKRRQKQAPDFLLQLRVLDPSGDPWHQAFDIWTTFFREYKAQLLLDARSQAVPTEDADASGRQGLVVQLLDMGLTMLTLASFLVPPVGLVMLGVTAVQLMNEVLEGVEDLSLGDKEAGWRHITGVLDNLITMGAGIPAFELLTAPAHAEFNAIELANGQKRLWKPDLAAYRSDVSLEGHVPNAQGQYRIADRHYVRVEGDVFEKRLDPVIGKWRIQHPKKPQAYQPILEADTAGNWQHTLDRTVKQPAQDASVTEVTDQDAGRELVAESDVAPLQSLPVSSQGISNATYKRYAVKASDIAGLTPSKGIFRSTDGQQFYIRNIDGKGKVAVYSIRNSFNLNADIVDVNIVDPNTNRATELRLWQVAPDQWQPLSLRGGNNAVSFDSAQSFTSSSGENLAIATADMMASSRPVFTRKQLPNGLSEPVIAVGEQRYPGHVPLDWGRPHQGLPFTAEQTNIRQALSVPEFSRVTINTNLFEAGKVRYSSSVAKQLANRQGGSRFVFEMQRMRYSGAVEGEFNAIKIVDIEAGEIPDQSNAVSGYWAPQGGYVDIPVHPGWAEPDYVFTPGFGGCSLVVDQLEENVLRVRHVEGGKEDAQYNSLPGGEHGWGQAAAMEYYDYGIAADQNNNADTLLGGFAFMKYDRRTKVWNIHYQSLQGTPNITRYSVAKPGLFGQSDSYVAVYEPSKVRKTMAKQVVTAKEPVGQKDAHAGDPLRIEDAKSFA